MGDDAGTPAVVSPSSSSVADGARGAIAGVASRFVTHPLDTMKSRAQVLGALASTSGTTMLGRGLYSGFGAVVMFAPAASGAYFVGYESGRRELGDGALALAATGMWAQALAGVVYTPMDVIKERLQTQAVLGVDERAGTYRNWAHAARVIAREEGARGLFRGYWAQNFVWWPWSATYFVIYERLRGFIGGGEEVMPAVSSACGLGAAAAATTLTHPLDLAKTRLQTLRFDDRASATLFSVLRRVVERDGVRGLFAGVVTRVASVAPGSAISFGAYETLRQSGW